MANQNDPLFDINAGTILAKLHLAAQTQVKLPSFVINTGIINPVDKADPEKLNNTTFDLKNNTHNYEVGMCRVDFAYYPPFSIKQNTKIQSQAKKVSEADAKFKNKYNEYKEFDTKSSAVDQNASDKKKAIKTEVYKLKKALEDEQKKLIKVIQDQIGVFADKEALNMFNNDKDILDSNINLTDEQKKELTSTQIQIYNVKSALKKENEYRKEQKQKNLDSWTDTTFKTIQEYFNTFCGKEITSKITKTDIVIKFINVDGKVKSPTTAFDVVEKYQIIPLSVKDIEKYEQEHVQKNPKNPFRPLACWCVGYTLETETM